MAINFGQGFNITSSEAVDARILKTKAEMKAMTAAQLKRMPENYFCICMDDDSDKGKIYIFDKSLETPLEETGHFRPFEEILNMAQAITQALQDPERKQELLESMTSMFNDEHFTIIDDKIDVAFSNITAIDGNE